MPSSGSTRPRAAGVVGGEDPELAVDRVAHRQPVPAAGVERHAVVERRGVVVDEGRVPGRAAVGGAVDPRRVARADREDHGATALRASTSRNGQALGAGGADVCPGPAAVGRAEHPGRAVLGEAAAGDPGRAPVTASRPRKFWSASTTVSLQPSRNGFGPAAASGWAAVLAGRLSARAGIVRRAGIRAGTPSRRIRSPSTRGADRVQTRRHLQGRALRQRIVRNPV